MLIEKHIEKYLASGAVVVVGINYVGQIRSPPPTPKIRIFGYCSGLIGFAAAD